MITLEILHENLEELASRDVQERLWLLGNGRLMSSVEEAVCGVFDDGGLTRALDSGYLERNFSHQLNTTAQQLAEMVLKLPENARPEDVIDHPNMKKVRVLAGELSALFAEETGSQEFHSRAGPT